MLIQITGSLTTFTDRKCKRENCRRLALILSQINLLVMDKIKQLERVAQFNSERGQKTLHPLVSVLDQSKSKPIEEGRCITDLYIIFLKQGKNGELSYGRHHYDYEDGTVLFIEPGQVFGHEAKGKILQPTGWALVFHPDLIRGTSLGKHIKEYSFFSYDVNEALHLSEREKQVIIECFNKIRYELEHSIDNSEIAYEIGFKYPSHFTRLFKQRVGRSPNEYRSLN